MAIFAYNEAGRFKICSVANAQEIPLESPVGNATNRLELAWFIAEIKKAFRGCEIRPSDSESRHAVYYVYMPEDELVMGYIDVDFCHAREKLVYTVSSRDVTNNKYSNYSDEFRTKVTAVQGTAIKNAKKYLRRFTHSELVKATYGDCEEAMARTYRRAISDFSRNWENLFGTDWNSSKGSTCDPLLNEMYMLLDSGHKFVDLDVPNNLTTLREARTVKDQADSDKSLPMYAVRVYERMDKQAFDICPLENMGLMARNAALESATYYDDLPEGVMGKLSTLSICEVGEYVPQVGYRYSEAVFYVAQVL